MSAYLQFGYRVCENRQMRIHTQRRNRRSGLATSILILLFGMAMGQSPYNVQEFGALGRKSQKATWQIQQTIDAAHDAGGGVVYFPPGEYLSGSLRLKSNVTLHLEAGATLFASRDTADFVLQDQNGRFFLIFADSAHHIGITGKGAIDGQAERVYKDLEAEDHFIGDLTQRAREAGVEMKMYYKVPPVVGLVGLESCTDITLTDFSLIESPFWTLHVKWSERVFISRLYVYSSLESGVNADGIDIDGCRNVVVSDCVVITGDDAIVLKSTQSQDGHYENCENIAVSNCVLTSTSSALKLGTESFGDFRHITFNNCVIRNSNRGLSIVARYGGTVEDILFSNITIDCNRKHFNWWGNGDPIWVVIRGRHPNRISTLRNVVFENIIAHGQGSSRIEGYIPHPPQQRYPEKQRIENVTLRNVQFFMHPESYPDKRADHALEIHDIDGITLDNIEVHWDSDSTEAAWQQALSIRDASNVRIRGFRARQGLLDADAPVIALENVQDALLQNIEANAGTATLIRISGEASDRIFLKNLDPTQQAAQVLKVAGEVKEGVVRGKE